MKSHNRALGLAVAVLFAFTGLQPVPASAASMREIRVGVAVAPNFKRVKGWKQLFERRLAYASKIFQTEFKIRFQKPVFIDWDVPEDAAQTSLLIEDLMSRFPLGKRKVDIMVGLTRLENPAGLDRMEMHTLGRARPFSGYMVLRYPLDPLYRVQEETVLVHELGHLFGAIHVRDRDSIMSPLTDRQIPSSFDRENREIITVTRDFDFRKGAESLDSATVQRLLGSYLKFLSTEQPFEFYYALGNLYSRLEQYESAVKVLTKAAELEPDVSRVHYDLGVLYSRLGNWRKAEDELSAAAAQLTLASQARHKSYVLNLLGGVYYKQKNYQGAQYAWRRALSLRPDSLDIQINLANVLVKTGQAGLAIQELETLKKKYPSHPRILGGLGKANYLSGDYEKAIHYFNLTLKAGEKEGAGLGKLSEEDIYLSMGSAYLSLGQDSRATPYFAKACSINPHSDCNKHMGRIYYRNQQWSEASQALMRHLGIYPKDVEAYGMMGVIFSRMDQVENAISAFQEGLKYAEDEKTKGNFYRNIGNLYMQLQEANGAMAAFQSSIANDWHSDTAHFGLGLAYMAQGRTMEARQEMSTALSINPGNAQARRMLDQMQLEMELRPAGG